MGPETDSPHFTMVCTLYDLYAWVEGMAFDISRMHASRCVLPSLDHSSLLEQICVGLPALKASNPPRSSEIPPRGSNEQYWKTQVLATRDDVTIERLQENQFCSLLKWTVANLIANENGVLSQGVSMVFEVWDFLRSKFVRRFHVPPSTYIHCLKVFMIFLSHFWFGRQTAAPKLLGWMIWQINESMIHNKVAAAETLLWTTCHPRFAVWFLLLPVALLHQRKMEVCVKMHYGLGPWWSKVETLNFWWIQYSKACLQMVSIFMIWSFCA